MKQFSERLTDPNDKYTVRCQKCDDENIEIRFDVLVCTDCGYVQEEQDNEREPEY